MSENMISRSGKREVAFALGGLGGSNAHGVGFLHAASKADIKPSLISCTSGMIYWTWRWLEGADLKEELEHEVATQEVIKLPGSEIKFTPVALTGMSGVFRPAWLDNWLNFVKCLPSAKPEDWLSWLVPARVCVPTRPAEYYERIAETFNRHPVPVLFNSYDVRHGIEYLHANPAGQAMLAKLREHREKLRPKDEATEALRKAASLPRVQEATIDADAVRDALWLTFYGFRSEDRPQERIDGAYIRQFILSELRAADVLLIPRPQSYTWEGPLPTNFLEVQDLQTELWFNAPYVQQVAQLDLVNRLVRQGVLKKPDYHEIELRPVEIGVQRGFFTYFLEDMDVFNNAVERSIEALTDL